MAKQKKEIQQIDSMLKKVEAFDHSGVKESLTRTFIQQRNEVADKIGRNKPSKKRR